MKKKKIKSLKLVKNSISSLNNAIIGGVTNPFPETSNCSINLCGETDYTGPYAISCGIVHTCNCSQNEVCLSIGEHCISDHIC